MKITEVRVKLVNTRSERVRAFCSVTFDAEFVIRDLKVIEGTNGLFVAMPSRKLSDRCHSCRGKNHLRARYCNGCGATLDENRAAQTTNGRAKLHADVAHPINATCRERIQQEVVEAVTAELSRASKPGYEPKIYEDDFETEDYDDFVAELRGSVGRHPEREAEGDVFSGDVHTEDDDTPAQAPQPAPVEKRKESLVSKSREERSRPQRSGPSEPADDGFSSGIW